LPSYIEETGISKLRDKAAAMDASKTLKQKMRERMQPKMGKIDIDYQTLHDAFFKH
jgi:splicing factor 3B subunit 2